MPQLNLQQLLNGDTIVALIDKINENFNQINAIGGGPQGRRGEQGPPGLPGLRGLIGDSGDNGENGAQVTIVGTDANWPTLYAGSPSGNTPATAAIAAGYDVGDIWIDNTVGVYYVIEETSPGFYEFVPYPISVTTLSTGDLWSPDTDSNLNINDVNQGIRNKNRFVTLSLTSIKQPPSGLIGESIPYNVTQGIFGPINPPVLEYNRSAYKLSIDNTSASGSTGHNDITRVKLFPGGSTFPVHYNENNDKSIPLVYLSDSSIIQQPSVSKNSFGLVLNSYNDIIVPNKNTGILTLAGSNPLNDQFFMRVAKVGTDKEIYFRGANNTDTYIRWIDIQNDGTPTITTSNNSLWLSMGSQQSTLTEPPTSAGANDHFNQFGIELRRYKNGGLLGGIVNFSGFDNINSIHTMSISRTGSLLVGNSTPAAGSLTTNDDDPNARLIVWQKGTSVLKLRRDNTATNNWNFSFDAINNRLSVNRDTTEVLSILPNGFIGMNVPSPSARLHIGGNLRINTVNNLQGNFLTWNSGTNEVTRRTSTEVRTDIGAVGGAGNATQVAYWGGVGPNTITGSNNLWYDPNNIRLGIGTGILPLDRLHINDGDIRLSGGTERQIKAENTLRILSEASNGSIIIQTSSGYTETTAPTTVSRIVLKGHRSNGILLYTPDSLTGVSIGDIKFRPGDIPIGSLIGKNGHIILERRVQVLNNDREDTSMVNVSVDISVSNQLRWLRGSGLTTNPANNSAAPSGFPNQDIPPTGYLFSAQNFDRLVTITMNATLATNTNHYRFVVNLNGSWTPLIQTDVPNNTGESRIVNCLIPAGCQFGIMVKTSASFTGGNYGVRFIRFGREDGGVGGGITS
jgi:hypothetical protein